MIVLGDGSLAVDSHAEEALYQLQGPIVRVTGFDVPYPYSKLEMHHLPGLDRILREAVRHDFPVNMLCWGNVDAGAALVVGDHYGLAGAWYRGGVGTEDIPSRNSEQMYPSGFVPDIGSDIRDLSAAFGYRTVLGNWSADVSTTYVFASTVTRFLCFRALHREACAL